MDKPEHWIEKATRSVRPWALLFILWSPACATIANDRSQYIPITSEPPGAAVLVDGVMVGSTPMVLKLRRSWKHVPVKVQLEGYRHAVVALEPDLSAWVLGDVGLAISQFGNQGLRSQDQQAAAAGVVAVVSMGIDAATGAAFSYDPGGVHVVLHSAAPVSRPPE